MKNFFIIINILLSSTVFAQNYKLNTGDKFPDINFSTVVNAPFTKFNLKDRRDKKLYVLNFWGTWCAPCIPQMERLAKLQTKFAKNIQVAGVSNDPKQKLVKFIRNRPSKIWLVSDVDEFLYRLADVNAVDQCMIVNADRKIIGIYKTESIDSKMITNILAGKVPASNAEFKGQQIFTKDEFGADSTTQSSMTLRSYMLNHESMGRHPNKGPFADRRISYYNITLPSIYTQAYNIVSEKQLIFEGNAKRYNDYNDKNQLYCLDVIVPATKKDSLQVMVKRLLNTNGLIKARIEERPMQVYVLKNKQFNSPASELKISSVEYSGNGFNGKGVSIKEFAEDYLTNEFDMPVIDETGLQGRYDITTTNDVRNDKNIMNAVNKLGFILEKAERKVRVLVLAEK